MAPRFSSPKHPAFQFAASLLALVVFILALDREINLKPAVGPLLNPFHGIWKHHGVFWDDQIALTKRTYQINGLKATVGISVDKYQVKHVFAESDEDLYFAQGYIVASERLWEMEFIARVAGGQLSEIFGRRTLEIDRYFTKMGLPEAARESARLMLNDVVTGPALRAYGAGVNAYIKTLTSETDPIEYRVLNRRPREWKPEHAAALLKYMAFELAGYNRELALSRSRSRLSKDDFAKLFPLDSDPVEPIIPRGTKFNFVSRAGAPPKTEFVPDLKIIDPPLTPDPSNGSNNWAISGKKSATGKPILSNDVHLGYQLPSLWYEMQLTSPKQNVYGATIPGAPGIILGFNEKAAWAVTNAGSDVMDWYQLRYRDDHRSEYLFEGSWRPVIAREMKISVRGEEPEPVLLKQTHLGPVVYDQSESPLNPMVPRGLAMKWEALEPSNELKSFLLLNRAKSVQGCREAIENYKSPAQNFLCADQAGDIALWHMGRFPVRWAGQGRMISDGSSGDYEWRSWIPSAEVPYSKNPARGFLSSANQAPADANYPHYLGSSYPSAYRAVRINEVLSQKKLFTPEDFVTLQGDTLSVLARRAVPLFLEAINQTKRDEHEKEIVKELAAWDFRYTTSSPAALFFEEWIERFETKLWAPHFPDRQYYQFPTLNWTLDLLTREPESRWFDNPTTKETETARTLIASSFHEAYSELTKARGRFKPGHWQWMTANPTEFPHIAKLPGLGSRKIEAPGVAETVFANKGRQGPTWKMVVALGPKPQAWTVYPGGQSGDPASRHYDDFLEPWRKNEMKSVLFLEAPGEGGPETKSFLFKPKEVKP